MGFLQNALLSGLYCFSLNYFVSTENISLSEKNVEVSCKYRYW